MQLRNCHFLLACLFGLSFFLGINTTKAQTVNVFVHQWPSTTWGFPDAALVQNAYSPYFTTVNTTTGMVPATGSLAGYDVLVICELVFGSTSSVISNAQRGVIESFVTNGGHVVWISENSPGQAAPGSDQSLFAISNLWGINLSRVPTNVGTCVPYHGGGGPGGLTTGVTSIGTTTSYDFFSGPATLHQNCVLAASGGTTSCTQSGIRGMAFLFPEPYICDFGGTIALYGEVQMWSSLMSTGQYLTHARNIAAMHHAIVTGNQPAINAINASFVSNANCSAPDPCSVLSVELSGFEAGVDRRQNAHLAWWTESEYRNRGFDVEHALPHHSDMDFRKVGWVQGAGTTERQNMYEFYVRNLIPGTHHFRLKVLDLDGNFKYSETRSVEVQTPAEHQVYPTTLTRETETMQLFWPYEDVLDVRLYDIQGREITILHQGRITESGLKFPLQSLQLENGSYFLRMTGMQDQATERIMVLDR